MNESFRNFIVRESTGDESASTPQHSPLKYLYDRGRRSVYSAPSRPLLTTDDSAPGKATTDQATETDGRLMAQSGVQPLVAPQQAIDVDRGPPPAQRRPNNQCATAAAAPLSTHAYRTDILERHLSALRDIDRRLDALQQRDHQISERILRTEQQLMRVQAIVDNAEQGYRARDQREQRQQQQFDGQNVFDRLSLTTESSSRGNEYGDLMWALIIVGGVVAVLLTVMIALSVRREQKRQSERKRAQQRSERRQDIQRAVLDALSQSQQPSLLQSRRGGLVGGSTATLPAYDDVSLTPSSPLLVGP